MRRIDASLMNAGALRDRFSKSLSNLRHRPSQCERPFDHPAPRQDLKTLGCVGSLDDLGRQSGHGRLLTQSFLQKELKAALIEARTDDAKTICRRADHRCFAPTLVDVVCMTELGPETDSFGRSE